MTEEFSNMKPAADQPEALESKPASKPARKDDLKTLPMGELQAKFVSLLDGLSR
jgi:hypothetical protein